MTAVEKVFEYVRYGSLDKIKALYDVEDIDLNMRNENGVPLIVYATNDFRPDIVKWLASRGANVNAADQDGTTALMSAAKQKSEWMVKDLFEAGAHPNLKDNNGYTALMHYVNAQIDFYAPSNEKDVKQMLHIFYHFGADPCVKNNEGGSVYPVLKRSLYFDELFTKPYYEEMDEQLYFIINAIVSKNERAAAYLAQTIENVNATDKNGYTALMYAAQQGYVRVMKTLIDRGADLSLLDELGQTALMHAADDWEVAAVRLLLSRGAKVDQQNKEGQTALMFAVQMNDWSYDYAWRETIEALLDGGADKDVEDIYGQTAMDYAEENGELSTPVEVLEIYEPKELTYESPYVLDPNLIQAALKDDDQLLKIYLTSGEDSFWTYKKGKRELSYGTNPYFFDKNGKSLFDYVIENNKMNALSLLLQEGLNPDFKNKNGHTPLYLAHKYENQEAIRLLISYGADRSFVRTADLEKFQDQKDEANGVLLSSSLIQAVLKEDKEELSRLLEAGKDPYQTNKDGKTIFDIAIENNLLRGLFNLVSLGVNPDFKNKNGQTPVEKALETGMKDAVELLVAFGAQKPAPNKISSHSNCQRHTTGFGRDYSGIY